MAKRSERPAGPVALTQSDVDALISGHRTAATTFGRRLNAEVPSTRRAGAPRRRVGKAEPVSVTGAEVRALARGGRSPATFARRLQAAERGAAGRVKRARRSATPKAYPDKKPPRAP